MLRLLNEQLIKEGGASGHLMHLYDNRDLSFAELKEVLTHAAEGRLERVTEKLDGMNLVFTWDGALKVARSGGDIKAGGMDAAALAQKFYGRENVEEAFNGAFQVLNEALSSLPERIRQLVFGNGSTWYSIEVLYSKNPNVINYDRNYVVFHQSPVFHVGPGGTVEKQNDSPGVDLLEKHIDRMQQALTQRSWQVRGPAVLRLKKFSDGSILSRAISAIEAAQNSAGVGDDATIGDYLNAIIAEEVADLGLPPNVAMAVRDRIVGNPGAPGLPQIKKMVTPDVYPNIKAFVDGQKALMKKAIEPIEHAVHNFAIEVLRGLHSVLIGNHDEEVARLRGQVATAVKAIQSSGNAKAMDVLATQMRKLGNLENIAAAMEGVVFIYKGNAYKFTGSFSPMNQILGLFKYGRGGTKISESNLREVDKISRVDRSSNRAKQTSQALDSQEALRSTMRSLLRTI